MYALIKCLDGFVRSDTSSYCNGSLGANSYMESSNSACGLSYSTSSGGCSYNDSNSYNNGDSYYNSSENSKTYCAAYATAEDVAAATTPAAAYAA